MAPPHVSDHYGESSGGGYQEPGHGHGYGRGGGYTDAGYQDTSGHYDISGAGGAGGPVEGHGHGAAQQHGQPQHGGQAQHGRHGYPHGDPGQPAHGGYGPQHGGQEHVGQGGYGGHGPQHGGHGPHGGHGGHHGHESDEMGPDEPLVRPYAMTGGRTRPRYQLAIEALVSTTGQAGQATGLLPEHQRIVGLCAQVKSVAEISALLTIPLGVARILVADLAEAGLVAIHQPGSGDAGQPDVTLLERVLSGLRKL